MQETRVQSLSQEDSLMKEKATHSSVLAWRISWTEEPGGLQSMGSQRVGTWLSNLTHTLHPLASLCISFHSWLVSEIRPSFFPSGSALPTPYLASLFSTLSPVVHFAPCCLIDLLQCPAGLLGSPQMKAWPFPVGSAHLGPALMSLFSLLPGFSITPPQLIHILPFATCSFSGWGSDTVFCRRPSLAPPIC